MRRVSELARAVRDYVFRSLTSHENGELDENAVQAFLARLPDVLGRCDEDIYDQPLAAEAYAFVHLLERYRRFWDVLAVLLEAGELVVRGIPIDVLDVGTGPAPALYAVNDFFEELRAFGAQTEECRHLVVPPPKLRSIESSRGMVRFVHNLSEFTGRPGPFRPDDTTFKGFDPVRARAEARAQLIDHLIAAWDYGEEQARQEAHLAQAAWQGLNRYHLCIFSNFFTKSAQVQELGAELGRALRALKPGGLVVVVGATGGDYPTVYRAIDEIVARSEARRLRQVPARIPCDYDDDEAREIKRLYVSVFSRLSLKTFEELKARLPRDLWDPDIPLKGPKAFGLRVYRSPDRPRGVRFKRVPVQVS